MSLYIHKYCTATVLFLLVVATPAHALDRFEEAPIHYSATEPVNPVSALQTQLDADTETLEFDPQFGYLPAVLDALKIPVSSQSLVFSKTSLQNHAISPATPRAIYFNDDVYIGAVQQGAMLEISTADPNLGAVFYTLSQEESPRPQFQRQTESCLQCHGTSMTRDIPGHLVRSLYTDGDGFPILKAGTFITTQESPLEERWGGWYATGLHGDARHMGNVIASEAETGVALDREAGANLLALPNVVDAAKYLGDQSDIVALMVLEHQTKMHNLFTQASFDTRFALRDQTVIDKMTHATGAPLSDATKRRIANTCDKLVDYLLFVDEAPLTDPITGSSDFTKIFSAGGPVDHAGRSLRKLDLNTRLFKYPVSYLIYAPQFDGLPAEARRYIYWRLWQILEGKVADPRYDHLTPELREVLREILIDTKSELRELLKVG